VKVQSNKTATGYKVMLVNVFRTNQNQNLHQQEA